jgi:hypothetical protein
MKQKFIWIVCFSCFLIANSIFSIDRENGIVKPNSVYLSIVHGNLDFTNERNREDLEKECNRIISSKDRSLFYQCKSILALCYHMNGDKQTADQLMDEALKEEEGREYLFGILASGDFVKIDESTKAFAREKAFASGDKELISNLKALDKYITDTPTEK